MDGGALVGITSLVIRELGVCEVRGGDCGERGYGGMGNGEWKLGDRFEDGRSRMKFGM